MERIYLDHNATTPPALEVREAMMPFVEGWHGNASSVHEDGRFAREAIDRARHQVAGLVGVAAAEIVFTSCATEANNLALRGIAESLRGRGRHVVTTTAEHPSVLGPAAWLETNGYEVTRVPVLSNGAVDLNAFKAALRSDTTIVSCLLANNETGALAPLEQLSAWVHEVGAVMHVDAVQAAGRVPIDAAALGADLLTVSGHKMRGPKGAAALYIRRGLNPVPLVAGGHQERGMRGGTENVPAIVGLGCAAILASQTTIQQVDRVRFLRDRLWDGIRTQVPDVVRNGDPNNSLPNTLNVRFEGCSAEALLIHMDLEGISASSGSACASGTVDPSHVLLAMGQSVEAARSAMRFSLGVENTIDEIDQVVELLPEMVERTRTMITDEHWVTEADVAWAN